MSEKKNIKVVVVGGGFGGCKTALELANKKGIDVTLISTSGNFEYHGALYRSATGRSPMEVVIPIHEMFKRAKNVEFVLDTIARIDPANNRLISETGHEYHYDVVVMALGNQVNYFGIKGMEQNSFAMSTIPQTIALRNHLTELFRKHGGQPGIAIVGGGATGVELAGEVNHYAAMVAKKYGGKPSTPKVLMIEGADRLLPNLDPIVSARAYKRLKELGVEIRLNTKVNSCEEGKVCLAGEDIMADIIVWTAGSCAVNFYLEHPKVFTLERGRVKVDKYLRATAYGNVYVIGDNAFTPYSGMAQTALHDAKYVAANLVRLQKGQKAEEYKPKKPVYVVPVGPNWAVYQTDKRQWSGRRAWLARRQADKWIFKNFLPYKAAIKQWRRGNRLADF